MKHHIKTIAACAITALAVGGASAEAGHLIRNHDIAKNTISLNRLTPSVQRLITEKNDTPGPKGDKGDTGSTGFSGQNGAPGRDGTTVVGPAGATGPAGAPGTPGPTLSSGNWGIVDRNTIGSPTATLRSGPASPPAGKGSLGITVEDGNEKLAYGNETDFLGVSLNDINALSFFVFTTGENNAISPTNLPSLGIEIDPTGNGDSTAPNYTTMVSVPVSATSNQWTKQNAGTGQFYLTGAAGTASGCNQTTYCTLSQIKTKYPAATLISVQITKGRDYSWQGAVDGLQINDKVYDLEESGVFVKPAA